MAIWTGSGPLLQLLGFGTVFLLGLFRSGGSLALPSILVGWVFVEGFAYIIVGGGGPGACPGVVLFPLYCGIAGVLGRGVRHTVKWLMD